MFLGDFSRLFGVKFGFVIWVWSTKRRVFIGALRRTRVTVVVVVIIHVLHIVVVVVPSRILRYAATLNSRKRWNP